MIAPLSRLAAAAVLAALAAGRFEVLLPLRFNDGSPVPDELIIDTLLELEQRFGAASCETAPIRGQWTHQGQAFRDDLMRVFVDIADLPEHRHFFLDLKDRLKREV